MRVYDEATQRTRTVCDECGELLPQSQHTQHGELIFCSPGCDDRYTFGWYSTFLRLHGSTPLVRKP